MNITRKEFCTWAVVGAAAGTGVLVAACGPKPKEQDRQEVLLAEEKNSINIYLDRKTGLPTRYVLPSSKEGHIDQKAADQARIQAIVEGQPHSLLYLSETLPPAKDITRFMDSGTKEHPTRKDLPDDVVSEEEATSRGIEIIPSTFTTLHLRQRVFEAGSMLESLKINGDKKLIIALVDGPAIDPIYLMADKYQQVKHLVLPNFRENEILANERKLKQSWSESLIKARKKYEEAKSKNDTEQMKFTQDTILYNEGSILKFSTPDHDVEFRYGVMPIGKFFDQTITGIPNTSIILLAVGRSPRQAESLIWFDPKGNCRHLDYAGNFNWGTNSFMLPLASDTHPDPRSIFTYGANSSSYVYAGKKPGFVLRHELAHFKITNDSALNQYHSEAMADKLAFESIQSAWEEWEKSNYTDDSSYYIVFEDRLTEGGYLMTQNTNQRVSFQS